jgi:hypothetical protein
MSRAVFITRATVLTVVCLACLIVVLLGATS